VTLSAAKGALLDVKNAKATVTIQDNDSSASSSATSKPTVSITATSKVFEDSDAQFTISLSQKSTKTVSVKYTTVSGTAKADDDFGAMSGTAIFKAGETKKIISIPVFQDDTVEKVEDFSLQLSNPKEATLNVNSAKVTISDGEGSQSSSSAMLIDLVGISTDTAVV
jgi:hypothetical protein